MLACKKAKTKYILYLTRKIWHYFPNLKSFSPNLNLKNFTYELSTQHSSGADPGILVRGGVGFFFKGMGFGAALRPPVGPGQHPGSSQGGEILVILGVKFNHIIRPDR